MFTSPGEIQRLGSWERVRTEASCNGSTSEKYRRGGRVVECGGLENRYTRKSIESSNLSLSAR